PPRDRISGTVHHLSLPRLPLLRESAITPSESVAASQRPLHRPAAGHIRTPRVHRQTPLSERHQLAHRLAPRLQRGLDRALRVANPLALQLPRRDLAAFKLESVNAHFAPLIVR